MKLFELKLRLIAPVVVVCCFVCLGLLFAAPASAQQGFEGPFPPSGWTFSGPTLLGGVAGSASRIIPTEGLQYGWISTGCVTASGTGCPDVATTPDPGYAALGLTPTPDTGMGTPTVETFLTSPTFALASTTQISFDVNFITTDGTNAFADFALVQLVPSDGTPIDLFVANTTCATCTAVPPVDLSAGAGTMSPATASFSGATVMFGATTYGNVVKFGGGNGGPTGWIHVTYLAPAGTYTLQFLVSHVGDTNFPSALAIDDVITSNTFTTPQQPIFQGSTNTFTDPGIITQTLHLPGDVILNGAAFMAVKFMQIPPTVFDGTRLPATSTNLWSGGSPVPAGTTLTPLNGTVGNANGIVAEKLCFGPDPGRVPIVPCEIFAPTTLIQLTSSYNTQAPQPNPALIIATDGQNDWANITEVFTSDPITGGSKGLNTDEAIVNLPSIMDTSNIIRVTGDFLNAGCIDNAGIVNALTSKLSAAQDAIGRGNIQTAINILAAFEKQVQAQSGKHIAASCTLGGITFDPATLLLTEVQSLINNLRTSDTADPITAYVVDSNGLGISGATVSIKDSFPHTVATATTDITGFYFFPTTGVLASGSSYTVQVTALPSGFTTSTPASQPFTWLGNGIVPSTIVLK
jgi:hypothetical protein